MEGIVLYGINNIFTLYNDRKNHGMENHTIEARIKGKILKTSGREYNPLAPGDRVIYDLDPMDFKRGVITERLTRDNYFSRWNNKRNTSQTVATNIDEIICIASPINPPFRPRFIDRVLIEAASIPVSIILNKIDQNLPSWVEDRLTDFSRIGYIVLYCSVKSGHGIDSIKQHVHNKKVVFVGQSGVGKSSLINAIYPKANLKIGEVSEKYKRGKHTTNYGKMLITSLGWFVDTPGIREIAVNPIEPEELSNYFIEFINYSTDCNFQPCYHLHEPKCAVKNAVQQGEIHKDRYESYLSVLAELKKRSHY